MTDDDMEQLIEQIRRKVTQYIVGNIPNILASQALKIVAATAPSPNQSPSDVRSTSFSSIEGGGHRFENDGHKPMPQLEEQHIQQTDDQHPM